jgi:hypothetical protein
MGREVRKVPRGWKHPVDKNGRYIPLFTGYEKDRKEYEKVKAQDGEQAAVEWFGTPVTPDRYMLVGVPEDKCTQYAMYEITSEGTPISPGFDTHEQLAQYLADTGASAFAGDPASYEAWLSTIRAGSAPSAVMYPDGRTISAVEFLHGEREVE